MHSAGAKPKQNRSTVATLLLPIQTHSFQCSEQQHITWVIGTTYGAGLFKKMPEEQNVKTYTMLPGKGWKSAVLGNVWVKTVHSLKRKKKLSVSVRHCVQQCSTDFRCVILEWILVPKGQGSAGLILKSYLKVILWKFRQAVFWYERNNDLLHANWYLNLWICWWGKLMLTWDDGLGLVFLSIALLLKSCCWRERKIWAEEAKWKG